MSTKTPEELYLMRMRKRMTVRKLAEVINAHPKMATEGSVFPSQLDMMEKGCMVIPVPLQSIWVEVCA